MSAIKAGYQVLPDDAIIAGAGIPVTIYALNVVSDSTAGTVSLYNDSTDIAADAIITLNGIPSKGVMFSFPNGLLFPADCNITLDDAHTTSVTAIYTRL